MLNRDMINLLEVRNTNMQRKEWNSGWDRNYNSEYGKGTKIKTENL